MRKRTKEKKVKAVPVGIGILIFALAFAGGAASKLVIKPSWAEKYAVQWSDELGTRKIDIPYGGGEANKFDLYLPADNTKGHYGLVVYLHAGGFTSGDKSGDAEMLSWLCSKGYAACGINYTLRTDTNDVSVLSQSNEIKAAIPKVIEAAEAEGYTIDRLAMAGGSAGHALAMLYAYRDAAEARRCRSHSLSALSALPASTRRIGTITDSTGIRRKATWQRPGCLALWRVWK